MEHIKIVEPEVKYISQGDDIKHHVAQCARVCYGRESGNDEATYNRLINDKHWSMFRHASVYAIINKDKFTGTPDILKYYRNCPYINIIEDKDRIYISTNEHFMLDCERENTVAWYIIDANRVDFDEAEANYIMWKHLLRYTFMCTTSIAISRELNRVSPNNIAERSTRYVLENGSITRPHWMNGDNPEAEAVYLDSCSNSFKTYKQLINDFGLKRQNARGVLPLDTTTKVIYTYTIDEWRHIINLRA